MQMLAKTLRERSFENILNVCFELSEVVIAPYDFHSAENMDGITESSYKNGIYCITRNVTEFVKF